MSAAQQMALARLHKQLQDARRNRLQYYKPYPKQRAFHDMGSEKKLRLLVAGNQEGKTHCGAAEFAMHVTGKYPTWWRGLHFDRPIRAWVAGISAELVRDSTQRKLVGGMGETGTGFIPADAILDSAPHPNIRGALSWLQVRHVTGGVTFVGFRSYKQGEATFQADNLDFWWLDEEPALEIWSECVARITATGGSGMMTFTPKIGMTEVVRGFYPRLDSPDKGIVRMGLKDALHIPVEDHEAIRSRYPAHERLARTEGIPSLGSGAIFPVALDDILEDPIDPIPRFWKQIIGIDLGGGEGGTAWVHLLHDPSTDTIHVHDTYHSTQPITAVHASSLRRYAGVPVAWPHDGNARERSSGERFADTYRRYGVRMLAKHAHFQDGANDVRSGLDEILNRMQDGRFKVSRTLGDWIEEMQNYHRKNGKVVKRHDHMMDATRYGVMMLRYARVAKVGRGTVRRAVRYDPITRRSYGIARNEEIG